VIDTHVGGCGRLTRSMANYMQNTQHHQQVDVVSRGGLRPLVEVPGRNHIPRVEGLRLSFAANLLNNLSDLIGGINRISVLILGEETKPA